MIIKEIGENLVRDPLREHEPSAAKFIDCLLKRQVFNDVLFEEYWFPIKIQLDSISQWLYRKLWEEVYLRRVRRYHPNGTEITMNCSLSECIQFIQAATPPRLQDQLPASLTSTKAIYDLMKLFLMEDNSGQQDYYLSLFRRIMHLEPFETAWKPNIQQMKTVRKKFPTGVALFVDTATLSLSAIKRSDLAVDRVDWIQLTIHAAEDDLYNLNKFLIYNHLIITNLFMDESGLYVSAYTDHISGDLQDAIVKIYDGFK